LTPDYWIDMGALAIATLAGALLLSAADRWSLLGELRPFLAGFALLFWTTATWWIPLLLLVEIWRHVWGHVKWTYSPDYWSLVFPLGMYSMATAALGKALNLSFLNPVAAIFAWAAAFAWVVTFFGLIRNVARQCQRSAS
jgi:tellurite resistance protein TehA-like permease